MKIILYMLVNIMLIYNISTSRVYVLDCIKYKNTLTDSIENFSYRKYNNLKLTINITGTDTTIVAFAIISGFGHHFRTVQSEDTLKLFDEDRLYSIVEKMDSTQEMKGQGKLEFLGHNLDFEIEIPDYLFVIKEISQTNIILESKYPVNKYLTSTQTKDTMDNILEYYFYFCLDTSQVIKKQVHRP